MKDIEKKITVQCSKCGKTIGPAPILHNKRHGKDIADIYVEHLRKNTPPTGPSRNEIFEVK